MKITKKMADLEAQELKVKKKLEAIKQKIREAEKMEREAQKERQAELQSILGAAVLEVQDAAQVRSLIKGFQGLAPAQRKMLEEHYPEYMEEARSVAPSSYERGDDENALAALLDE